MNEPQEEHRHQEYPEHLQQLAHAVVRAADRAAVRRVSGHESRLHPEASAPAPIPIRVLADVVTWLMLQYQDTGLWDVEAASAKFDIPTHVLWPELGRYFRSRANGGWER